MRLIVEISLGNDAMRTGSDLSHALERIARVLPRTVRHGDGAKVMDHNGNSVGRWEVTDDD